MSTNDVTQTVPTIHVLGPGGTPLRRDDGMRRSLLDARARLDALVDTWTWAAEAVRTGAPYVDPIRKRGQIDDHLIWDLGHARDHQRISRTDGQKGDRRKPIVRIGRWARGEGNWEVRLHGRARPAADMTRVTSVDAIENGVESLLMASACLDAALAPPSPEETATAHAAMEAIAHEEASIRGARYTGPGHLRPCTVAFASTPWSAPSMRLRHPHKVANERVAASTRRTSPVMVNLLLIDESLDLSPHNASASYVHDPVMRLRILSSIDELAPPVIRRPRRKAA